MKKTIISLMLICIVSSHLNGQMIQNNPGILATSLIKKYGSDEQQLSRPLRYCLAVELHNEFETNKKNYLALHNSLIQSDKKDLENDTTELENQLWEKALDAHKNLQANRQFFSKWSRRYIIVQPVLFLIKMFIYPKPLLQFPLG